MRILLLGSTGMLGSECKKILSQDHEVIAPDKKELDIISWDGVIETLDEVSPDVVVNCVGLTDMDVCETDGFAVRKIRMFISSFVLPCNEDLSSSNAINPKILIDSISS